MSGQGAGERFDLVIRGGDVLDPGAGIEGRYDLGIRDGHVAAIEPAIDPASAEGR